jgi:hypothetical protein
MRCSFRHRLNALLSGLVLLCIVAAAQAQERLPPVDAQPTAAPSIRVASLMLGDEPTSLVTQLQPPPLVGNDAPPASPTGRIAAPSFQFSAHRQDEAAAPPAGNLEERLRLLEQNQDRLEGMIDNEDEDADGPADDYDSVDELFPDYVYEPWYFDTPYIGARPLADYAPPGYEPRDQQEGPAVPEFRRIQPPARTTQAERDDLVVGGMYPGSFLAPGTNTSVRLRGFVRLAALYDFDPIGVSDAFVTNSIPVPQLAGENFNMSGRISRFALETWTPTSFCDWNVHTFIEGDFFNGPAQAAGGGGNPFRLRHAFFDFGYSRRLSRPEQLGESAATVGAHHRAAHASLLLGRERRTLLLRHHH